MTYKTHQVRTNYHAKYHAYVNDYPIGHVAQGSATLRRRPIAKPFHYARRDLLL